MKVFAVTLLLTVLAAPALAQDSDLLLYEGFDYAISETLSDNVLQGKTPTGYNPTNLAWYKSSGAPQLAAALDPAADLHRVVAGSLTYPDLPESVGGSLGLPRVNQNVNFTKILLPGGPYNHNSANESVFFSVAIKLNSFNRVADGNGAGEAGDYSGNFSQQQGSILAGFTPASSPTAGMSVGRVYAGMLRARRKVDVNGVQDETYQLGFHKNNQDGMPTDIWSENSFAVDQTVFVVGEYHFNADRHEAGLEDNTLFDDAVRLWINPTLGQTPTEADIISSAGFDTQTDPGTGFTQASASAFYFLSRNNSPGQIGDFVYDELRIGKTYAAVTPFATADNANFNGDDAVDGEDFLIWQAGNGIMGAGTLATGDANSDFDVNDADYGIWASQFGTTGLIVRTAAPVPEPSSALLFVVALALAARRGGRSDSFSFDRRSTT